MAFDSRHKLLTVIGELWTSLAQPEQWTFGLRFDPPSGQEAVSQAQVDACDAVLRTLFVTTTSGAVLAADNRHSYLRCKLAPIDTNGNYPSGEQAFESASVRLAGTGNAAINPWPGQCTPAVTLFSSRPGGRGLASKGRIYLPPIGTIIGSDGTITATTAQNLRQWTASLIGSLNDVVNLGTCAIYSGVGAGVHFPVTGTRAGRVVDTQRRRRRQLQEQYTTTVPIP